MHNSVTLIGNCLFCTNVRLPSRDAGLMASPFGRPPPWIIIRVHYHISPTFRGGGWFVWRRASNRGKLIKMTSTCYRRPMARAVAASLHVQLARFASLLTWGASVKEALREMRKQMPRVLRVGKEKGKKKGNGKKFREPARHYISHLLPPTLLVSSCIWVRRGEAAGVLVYCSSH